MDFASYSDARVTHITEGSKAGTEVRLLSHNDDITIVHNVRKAGAIFPLHEHSAAQVYVIVSGKVELTAGNEVIFMETGDTLYVAGGVPHGAKILQDTVEYEIFVPGRNDLVETYK